MSKISCNYIDSLKA